MRRNLVVEEDDAAELKLGADFQNEHCLMNCEVKVVLSRIRSQRPESTEYAHFAIDL